MLGFLAGVCVTGAAGYAYLVQDVNTNNAILQKAIAGLRADVTKYAASLARVDALESQMAAHRVDAATKNEVEALRRLVLAQKVS